MNTLLNYIFFARYALTPRALLNEPQHTERQAKEAGGLIQDIRTIINQARSQVRQTVNAAMVLAYWDIGYLIVENEQGGKKRASYGKQQLQQLSKQLIQEYGKGFDVRNLRNMRRFYLAFPIRNAVRTELSWTHYRNLIRLENTTAREWYIHESIEQNWSARALERQITKLYYERLIASKNKVLVEAEAKEKTSPL